MYLTAVIRLAVKKEHEKCLYVNPYPHTGISLLYSLFFFLLIMFSAAVSVSMAVMLPALMVMAAHGIWIINQAAA